MSESINVQETFNILPRVGPDSSREDMQVHIMNSHSIILGINSFIAQKGLSDEFMEWCQTHIKMLDTMENYETNWGVINN